MEQSEECYEGRSNGAIALCPAIAVERATRELAIADERKAREASDADMKKALDSQTNVIKAWVAGFALAAPALVEFLKQLGVLK